MPLFRRRKTVPFDATAGASGVARLHQEDIDIWAMRDAGYVDPEGLEVLRNRFGVTDPLVVDYEVEPDDEQKQRVIEKYEQIAAYLNTERHDGRRDWTARHAWSLGRATTAKEWGHDPAETLLPTPWPARTSSEHDSSTST